MRSLRGAWAPLLLGALVVLGTVANLSNLPGFLAFVPYAVVGSLLVIRRPRNLIGWLLVMISIGFSLVGHGLAVTAALVGTSWEPWLPALAWVGTMSGIGLFAALAVLTATFPTGHLPAGANGRVARAALVLVAIVAVGQALDPVFVTLLPDGTAVEIRNPLGIAPDWAGWAVFDGPAYMLVLGAIVVCTVGVVTRFRRAVSVERQQDKWFLASLAAVVGAVTFGFVSVTLVDHAGTWGWIPAVFSFPLPAIAIGIAITRYRLYDIDRIISRTIAYAGLSLMLFAVFTGVNLVLQSIFESLVSGGSAAVAASTLAVAALFNPLRGRVQRVVDRRFNRARQDADETTGRFAKRLRDQLDLDTIGTELTSAVIGAVEPMTATFWLRGRVVPR